MYTPKPYRGFESLALRQKQSTTARWCFVFAYIKEGIRRTIGTEKQSGEDSPTVWGKCLQSRQRGTSPSDCCDRERPNACRRANRIPCSPQNNSTKNGAVIAFIHSHITSLCAFIKSRYNLFSPLSISTVGDFLFALQNLLS